MPGVGQTVKREYERQNPQTKKGVINRLIEPINGTSVTDTFQSFTESEAESTGKNRRTIQNEIRVGEKLLPKNHQAIINLSLSKKEIYFISGLPPDHQTAVIDLLKDDPEQDIKELTEDIRKSLLSSGRGQLHKNTATWGIYGFNVILIENGSSPEIKIAGNAVLFLIASEKTFLQEVKKMNEWGFTFSGILVIEKPGRKTEFCIIGKRGNPIFRTPEKRIYRGREKHRRPDEFYKAIEQATKATKNRIAFFDGDNMRPGWSLPE